MLEHDVVFYRLTFERDGERWYFPVVPSPTPGVAYFTSSPVSAARFLQRDFAVAAAVTWGLKNPRVVRVTVHRKGSK